MKKLKPNKFCKGIFYFQIKILKFPSNCDIVSDDDILSLMSGLIKLIKKSTEVRVEEKYLRQIELLNNELNSLKRKLKN